MVTKAMKAMAVRRTDSFRRVRRAARAAVTVALGACVGVGALPVSVQAIGFPSHPSQGVPSQLACGTATPGPLGPPVAGSTNPNKSPGATGYVPAALCLRDQRPYLPLDRYTTAPASDPVVQKFNAYVARAQAGNPDWGYSAADAVVQFARTGEAKYIDAAIADAEAQVAKAETAIAAGKAPAVAGDSYLHAGPMIEELALAYDWGHSRLTQAQRDRFRQYGDRVIANIWNPPAATWGSAAPGTFSWSGWSINNPGNNYHFSFIQATQLWAIATQQKQWLDFLQQWKFPLMHDYLDDLAGGGSREGTGYGVAARGFYTNALDWEAATGERLVAVENHARDSIDYWIHATTPRLDEYQPYGDLTRSSTPTLYDYHENLVRTAAMLVPNTPQATRGLWWIKNNSVPDTMENSFNLRPALLRPEGTAVAPTALTYYSPFVGQFFARTSWGKDAAWFATIAGPYDESHAHAEQGTFSLHRGTTKFSSANRRSRSGLQGNRSYTTSVATGATNIVRFDVSGGGTVHQNYSTNEMTTGVLPDGSVTVKSNLKAAYSGSGGKVKAWTREMAFTRAGELRVVDRCDVATNIRPVWQLQTETQPTVASPGLVKADGMYVSYPAHYGFEAVSMPAVNKDFQSGWRLELTNPRGCTFEVALLANAPTGGPGPTAPSKVATTVSAAAKPKRDRRAPYVYTIRGRVNGSFQRSVTTCKGDVAVTVWRAKRKLGQRIAKLDTTCGYKIKVRVSKKRLAVKRKTALKVKVRYRGSDLLKPSAVTRRVVAR